MFRSRIRVETIWPLQRIAQEISVNNETLQEQSQALQNATIELAEADKNVEKTNRTLKSNLHR